jgi:flagellar protein FliO/FliZ
MTGYVLQSLVTLLGVVALAVLVLMGARRIGVGRPSGPLELLGRLPIDARRAVYLVRAGTHTYVLGGSEAGLTMLGELEPKEVPEPSASAPRTFGSVLSDVLRQHKTSSPSETDSSHDTTP